MRSLVVGTAGHIDHGKSALVRALTGTDPDRLKEEKARGITIDLGFAHTKIDGVDVAFVDVPGHERFVKNMLAGVSGIDVVLLVIAADESVMPQTREHFDICRLLRVPVGLVALTKTDLVDVETLELARLETRELVAGSFLDGAPIVGVSARDGSGLDELRAALISVASNAAEREHRSVTRLPIDRVFTIKGFGTVVTGTLASGHMTPEQELRVLPGGRAVKVRGVQVHGERQTTASAGQRTAVNIGGVEVDELARGQSLVTPGAFEETRIADVLIDILPGAKPLKHGARVRFHQGTAELIGRVGLIGPDASPVGPGSRTYARLRLEGPAVVIRGDRFILRTYSPAITFAGGIILDPSPSRSRIRTQAAVDRCRALDETASTSSPATSSSRAAAALIAEAGRAALSVSALVWRLGIDPTAVSSQVAALVASGDAVVVGGASGALVSPSVAADLERAIVGALTAHHRAQPLAEGVPRDELRVQLFPGGHQAVFDRALDVLSVGGQIVVRDRVALASHRIALTPAEAQAHEAIERAFREAALTPPDLASLAATLTLEAGVVDRMVKLLQRQKVLVRLETLTFHEEALKRLKADVAGLKAGAPSARIDVAMFKARFGVSRKFAIPLLEYLDRERVTRRVGDARVIL